MQNRSGTAPSPTWEYGQFPRTLSAWLEHSSGLLEGLASLRELGDEAADAVDALMELNTVRKIRLGWELWEALLDGEQVDPDPLLLDEVAYDVIELAKFALWGPDDEEVVTGEPPTLRLVPS